MSVLLILSKLHYRDNKSTTISTCGPYAKKYLVNNVPDAKLLVI